MCDKAKDDDDLVIFICGINAQHSAANFACACGKNAVARGAHAGNIVKAIASIAGGSGGGRPDSAMAGTKSVDKIDEAMSELESTLRSMLK
jgi:alanyl-tRNA synthetase